jgi:hypothetical protein
VPVEILAGTKRSSSTRRRENWAPSGFEPCLVMDIGRQRRGWSVGKAGR